jgi:hypothetical protein
MCMIILWQFISILPLETSFTKKGSTIQGFKDSSERPFSIFAKSALTSEISLSLFTPRNF